MISFRVLFTTACAIMIYGSAVLGASRAKAQVAQPGLCGETYTIERGDSLSSLARRVFGTSRAFMEFYKDPRNVETLGPNPNVIVAGRVIHLPPCPDTTARTETAPAESEFSASPKSAAIEVVTGSHYAPFTDLSAPGRGMLTEVVSAAIEASDLSVQHRIDFINDWGAHLNLLLPYQKYHFAFPWFRPDCSDPAKLPEPDRIRCSLAWSQPLYSLPIAIYGFTGEDEQPRSFDDLAGSRLCRPAGYFIFDLAEAGLTENRIELVRPDTPDACFTALERGETDYVTLNRFTAEKAIARGGFAGIVEALPDLVTTQTLHLVAHQNNRHASEEWLGGFNEGLSKIQADGVFDAIVARHIERHNQEVADLAAALPN